MGTNIAWRLLPGQFNGTISLVSKKLIGADGQLSYAKGTAYINIGKNIAIDDDGLNQVLNYVDRGNEFFISGDNIDYRLLDTLGVKHAMDALHSIYATGKKYTTLYLADTTRFGKGMFGFFYYPFNDVFTRYDSSTTTVLGVNENQQPDYIVVRYGKGKFYFHTEPAAFTNYFLLTATNTKYFSEVFSYLDKNVHTVFWADTERFSKKPSDFSALAIFWKNPLLKYALLTTCALMLLYIAFGSKRKRRLVPERLANTNASLSFVQTIGNLYLQRKDNRNIAVKKITYFLEFVRSNYHMSTSNINPEFIQALSRKSGIAETKVQLLMEKAEQVNISESISDQELFDINNIIDEFYKR